MGEETVDTVRGDASPATLAVREAVRELLHEAHGELRQAVDGADAATLAWTPDAPDANSISGLVFHVVEAERWLLHNAVGRSVERDRDAQFGRNATSAVELLAVLDAADAEADRLLEGLTDDHLEAVVARNATRTGAAWLARSVGHAREHSGQALLTRDLAGRRSPQDG
jgi:hypothetical protein